MLVQHALPDFRPYLHPVLSPDGQGVLTEYSPGHHKHQTGLYWGFTRVNGRDYFHHPEGDYWRKVSLSVIDSAGESVSWQTVYHLLDSAGTAVMEETQTWAMSARDGKFFLNLEWQGTGLTDITIGEYDYGGLFLRMPWKEGIAGEVVNAARQRNAQAEGQRAMWVDVGMEIEGLEEWGHVAIFDHPENKGFPQPWRVDGQLGIGPVRARMGDWSIPQGETETIRHQIVVYTGVLQDLEITDDWNAYIGSNSIYSTASLWGIAQEEGRNAQFLDPQAAVDAMTVKEGFDVSVWAGEPMVSQPMAFCWDDRGRLWVAENRDYESRGDGFSNSGDSRIVILEDTDGDGVADHRKVFLEGIAFPSAIAVGFDGLYLGAPPHLLFVPDKDQNDEADREDIEILLTGWGIRDRHETINSFHWGPDGWLYGLEGFATPSKIRKPAADAQLYGHKDPFPEDLLEAEGVDINGGVWRYHPVKDRFEVVAHGFSNPWGIDYDAKGQLFISACVIPHLFHVIPGGIYQRQGGQHFNPYVYQDIQTIVDHRHRSAHGGARVYLSDAFPPEQRGRLFMANIHEHAVLSDVLEKKGSGFVAHHGEDFLLANNAQWIGFSMEIGPSGDLYVLDWHDADICGKEVLHKETGRIFRISPSQSGAEDWPGRYSDLKKMSDGQLAALQTRPSAWHARRARVILQHRATQRALTTEALETLRATYRQAPDGDHRLRGMWALHITGNLDGSQLLAALDDSDPYVRAWAVQFLTEEGEPAPAALARMTALAEADPSPIVRLYLAAALQRIAPSRRWELAAALAGHAEDAEDHNLPHMVWFGVEPLMALDAARALRLAAGSELPLLSQHLARRAVDAGETEALVALLATQPAHAEDLLLGMQAGLEGRHDLKAPAPWAGVYERLRQDPQLGALAQQVAAQFGDAAATQAFLATLDEPGAETDARRQALKGLAARKVPALADRLPALIDDPALRIEAIRAVAAYDEAELGELLLTQYGTFSEAAQLEVVQAMATRPVYGRQLTAALKDGQLPKREVPAYVARQLRRVVGNGFVEVWGPIDQLSGDKAAEYRKYQALLTPTALEKADLPHGRQLFRQTCGACHKLYGEGGDIGPDITGANRHQIDYLLNNILSPSEEIQDDYRMVILTTREGRTYIGSVASENPRQLTLRVIGQDPVTLNKSEIQSKEEAAVSLMPEGLLSTLDDREVIDLIAYLQTQEQVAMK